MRPAPGSRLGPYEILDRIGAGGMGEVFRARDPRLDRFVAIKVLPERLSEDADALARFERESRALAALNHPGILAIFDVGRESGTAFVVMELLEGSSLREVMSSPVTPRRAVELAVDVARALSAAHEKGVVHRDVKPENIWVSRSGQAKLLDFGLAKLRGVPIEEAETLARDGDGGLPPREARTETGAILGTVGYMSPEQARGMPLDARTDLFSLGVVLWELVAGERPFGGGSAVEVLHAIITAEPHPIDPARALPPGLAQILQHCLEKDREARFQSARDLAFALESLSFLSTAESARAVTHAPPAPPRRRPLVRAFGALLVGIGAAAWLLSLRTPGAPPAFRRLTFQTGDVHSARFDRDGQTILFSATFSTKGVQTYLTRTTGTEARPLDPPGAQLLSVSRGDALAILTNAVRSPVSWFAVTGSVSRADLAGGAPLPLADHVLAADFSPDGRRLAVIRLLEDRFRIEELPGGVLLEGKARLAALRYAPDGRSLAFLRYESPGFSMCDVALLDLATRRVTSLSKGVVSLGGLAWAPDGGEVWYTTFSDPGGNLHAVDRSGRLRTVASVPDDIRIEDIAADGRVLLVHGTQRSAVIGQRSLASPLLELGLYKWSYAAALADDGSETVVFSDTLDGSDRQLGFRRSLEGGDPIPFEIGAEGLDVAYDGRDLLVGTPGDSPSISVWMPDGTKTAPVRVANASEVVPVCRRSGTILAVETGPGGIRSLVARPPGEGTPRMLLKLDPEKDRDLVVDPARKWMVLGTPAAGYRRLSLEDPSRPPLPVHGLQEGEKVVQWSEDGKALLTFTPGRPPLRIRSVDVESGRGRLLRELPLETHRLDGFRKVFLSRDGRAFVANYLVSKTSLYLVSGLR